MITDAPVDGRVKTSLSAQGTIRYADNDLASTAGSAAEPIFSQSDLEQLCFRRYNPFAQLNAQNLTLALDQFDSGVLMYAARFWQQIVNRDDTIPSVKSKREEAVALRDLAFHPLDDSSQAKDQAAALQMFYRNLRAGHALNRHTAGGLPLLLTQMMESVAFMYAVHHIVWKPDSATQWTLPSGRKVPALTALFEQVPLEFFEARTGELRFLGLSLGFTGTELEPGNWLVTTGPGLMRAASSLFYFKRLASHDLVNFSEKFGTPGIEVTTMGAKDSPEGQAARDLAKQLASNWRGVRYGAEKNGVNFLWPTGGVSGTELPMHTITDDAKRSIIILWLGADLSTSSRGGGEKAVGSLAQEDEREKRERADCARISETLNASIDPLVIHWFFGDDAPILAKTVIESPINEDRSLLANLVGEMVGMGAQVPIEPTMKRLGVPVAKEGEEVFQKPTIQDGALPADPEAAINSLIQMATNRQPRHQQTGRFLEHDDESRLISSALNHIAGGIKADMRPIAARIEKLMAVNDAQFAGEFSALIADLPDLSRKVIGSPAAADAFYNALSSALVSGLASNGGPGSGRYPKGSGEQIKRGKNAIRTSLDEKSDVLNAMDHPKLGPIDFRHGEPGDPAKEFKGGFGVSHIAAKHGEETAMKMPEVITRGEVTEGSGGARTFIEHGEHRVVLAKDFNGNPANRWLVTAYEKKGNR